ncbi:hypothetical protein FQN60_013643, partial [Etheostoma spectabile]
MEAQTGRYRLGLASNLPAKQGSLENLLSFAGLSSTSPGLSTMEYYKRGRTKSSSFLCLSKHECKPLLFDDPGCAFVDMEALCPLFFIPECVKVPSIVDLRETQLVSGLVFSLVFQLVGRTSHVLLVTAKNELHVVAHAISVRQSEVTGAPSAKTFTTEMSVQRESCMRSLKLRRGPEEAEAQPIILPEKKRLKEEGERRSGVWRWIVDLSQRER